MTFTRVGLMLGLAGVFGIFWLVGQWIPDSDFGWHIRLGELIVKQGIPRTDPFTFTMPSYPFVDYEWGTEVVWYVMHSNLGMVSLIGLYSVVAILSALMATGSKNTGWNIPIWLFVWSVEISRFGVRPQVISWLFIAVLIRWVTDQNLWEKSRFWFIPLMLVWSNVHGSFPLGVLLMAGSIAIRCLLVRKMLISDLLVVCMGILVTVINPYGLNNWREIIHQMSTTWVNAGSIAEWEPFWSKADLGMWGLTVMAAASLANSRKKIDFSLVFMLLLVTGLAISSLRHGPILAIVAAGIASFGWKKWEEQNIFDKEQRIRLAAFKKVLGVTAGLLFALEAAVVLINGWGYEERNYPKGAVSYVVQNMQTSRFFNKYGWGGYLEWKIPEKKWFIDGRMSNFSWKAPAGESDWVFLEYLKIKNGVGVTEVFDKYKVDAVLWGKTEQFDLISYLLELGWTKVYEDKVSVILVK